MAAAMSVLVKPKLLSFSGSSHTRIAYCDPNICTSPTPCVRFSWSRMFVATKSPMSSLDMLLSAEMKPSTTRKLRVGLATRMPCCCTS